MVLQVEGGADDEEFVVAQRRIFWDTVDGEIVVEHLHRGVDVIFRLGMHVINLCHLGPVVVGDPLTKLSQG